MCLPLLLLLQVYAHTSSRLQRDVLSRLMRTDCLLPNLYVGTLTREAFMTALEAGLTAADITHFLQQHAHPQVARRAPTVPEVCGADGCWCAWVGWGGRANHSTMPAQQSSQGGWVPCKAEH